MLEDEKHLENPKLKQIWTEPYDEAGKCLKTNYYGVKAVTEALTPFLQLSDSRIIVKVHYTARFSDSCYNHGKFSTSTNVANTKCSASQAPPPMFQIQNSVPPPMLLTQYSAPPPSLPVQNSAPPPMPPVQNSSTAINIVNTKSSTTTNAH
ncbi:hypothetical protein MKX01_000597 [Papaver californicum]|nr:hypothetical protein MKX01_000597 [Papaver californicum]